MAEYEVVYRFGMPGQTILVDGNPLEIGWPTPSTVTAPSTFARFLKQVQRGYTGPFWDATFDIPQSWPFPTWRCTRRPFDQERDG